MGSLGCGAVDFEIAHAFPHSLDEVAAAILDEDYQQSLADIESLKSREVLSQEERPDGTVVRRVRCVLDLHITGMAKSLIGDGEPAWVEESTWYPDRNQWEWVVQPEIADHLLKANGYISLRGDGDKTERVVHGDVKVSVPLYGGKVEGRIVDGLEHAYAEEAERLQTWLGR